MGLVADGVGVKFPPFFCSELQLFALVLQGILEKCEEKRRQEKKGKKSEGKTKKEGGTRAKSSDPIYTNAVKNFPKEGEGVPEQGP